MGSGDRPIVSIPTTYNERIYDGISTGVLLTMVLMALWGFLNLPEIIPIHWNFKGEVDGFGSRNWIAFIPVLSLLYALGNRKLVQIPHKYNYLKTITEENASIEYLKARKMMRVIHLTVQVVFALITYSIIKGAITSNNDLSGAVLPIALVLLIAPLIYTIYTNRKEPKVI